MASAGDLHVELLSLILGKLDLLPDYIRFGAVCKSWHSVFQDDKQKRVATIFEEPPLLLIPAPDKSKEHRNLYSICERKFYNCRLQVPYSRRCCGSTYGWLAVAEQDLSIKLLNPLSGKTIHLPILMEDPYKGMDRNDYPLLPEFEIHKIILSCDPSRCPDDFMVYAIYDVCPKVAFIKSEEDSWTYAYKGFKGVKDVLFHGGRLMAVNGDNELAIIDYKNKSGESDPSSVEFIIECPDSDYSEYSHRSYLVESSKKDLLLVRRIYLTRADDSENFRVTVDFKVYKMEKIMNPVDEEKENQWVEIRRLDGDDTLFLGDNQSICIRASRFPNCNPNSIYYTDDNPERDPYAPHKSDDMAVFDLENRKISKHCRLSRSLRYMSPAAWIFPTLQ